MQDDFFLESIYRRFDAAIDRIDSRGRSPTPREADVLTQVLEQIKAENFERERIAEYYQSGNRGVVACHERRPACGGAHHDTGTSQSNERDPNPSSIARRTPRLWRRNRSVEVGAAVGNVKNNRPELMERVGLL
jgi:hypothetical protein